MNRYQQNVESQIITQNNSQNSQKFQSCDHSLECIENQQQFDQQYLPSVRKYLSKPNPLMNKIQFTSYFPKWHFPRQMTRIPKCLNDYSACQIDKNNMNSILQSVKGHQKLRKNVLNALINNKKNKNQFSNNLTTIEKYYMDKQPVYQKYSSEDIKLQQNKFKLKYFATFVLDMAKIFRKQIKQKINHNTNININEKIIQNTIPTKGSTSSKTGNFMIRQTKSNITAINQKMPMPLNHKQQSNSKLPKYNQIQFDSNFQSGNLFRVYQKQFNQYDLILQNDINTKGNTQWFFFSIKGVPKNTNIKFNIVNMSKQQSLFNLGMRPYIFSMMRYEKRNIGWVREGSNISYQQSQNIHKQSNKLPYYTLSFEYKFIYDGDIVYFSHSIPYTFTDLSSYLHKITTNKSMNKFIKLKNVGFTLGSNEIDLIEISNNQCASSKKKVIWIIARQHPGQTNSGFILQGIIDTLLSNNQSSQFLLNNFIFKIIPMVNVDGVIHGNTRAQFIGSDPNRRWAQPNKLHNPIIHSIKHYIEKDKQNIELFLDLHAHSRKLGTFFYGNTTPNNTAATRIYPLMVCKKDSRFTFNNCRFLGGSNNTARFALFQSLNIPLIYTVQSSFYGYQQGDHRIINYTPKDYNQMGQSLMTGFIDYQLKKNSKIYKMVNGVQVQETINIEKQFEKQIKQNQADENQSVGSDSQPDADQYNQKQFTKLVTNKTQKKKKKLKKKKQSEIKPNKIRKEIEVTPVRKPKANNSESFYRQLFSGRVSSLKNDNKILTEKLLSEFYKIKKQTLSIGIQVQAKENSLCDPRNSLSRKQSTHGILTQRNQIATKLGIGVAKNFPITVNTLYVIGQKVQQIQIFANSIGIQVSDNKQMFMNRNQNQSSGNRKSFSVRTRTNSFLQVKQNNFLQRGDCMNKNFFSRK